MHLSGVSELIRTGLPSLGCLQIYRMYSPCLPRIHKSSELSTYYAATGTGNIPDNDQKSSDSGRVTGQNTPE